MAHLIDQINPLEYSKPSSAFSSLAHFIIEQILSMKSAARIERRVQDLCNGCITPESLLDTSVENLRYCEVSNSKACYLRRLAEFALVNNLDELSGASDDATRATCFAVPGIGKWT